MHISDLGRKLEHLRANVGQDLQTLSFELKWFFSEHICSLPAAVLWQRDFCKQEHDRRNQEVERRFDFDKTSVFQLAVATLPPQLIVFGLCVNKKLVFRYSRCRQTESWNLLTVQRWLGTCANCRISNTFTNSTEDKSFSWEMMTVHRRRRLWRMPPWSLEKVNFSHDGCVYHWVYHKMMKVRNWRMCKRFVKIQIEVDALSHQRHTRRRCFLNIRVVSHIGFAKQVPWHWTLQVTWNSEQFISHTFLYAKLHFNGLGGL